MTSIARALRWLSPMVLVALCAAPALAVRPATQAEAEAIQADLALKRCGWYVAISTVDTSWARVEADPEQCAAVSSRTTTAYFDGTRWTGSPWTYDFKLLCPEGTDIPPEVAGDLGLCVAYVPPPRTLLACDDRRHDLVVYRRKPRACALEFASQSYGEVVNLRRLHWRHWGSAVAKARGREAGKRVKVVARRLRRICGDPDASRAYTRVRVSSRRGVVRVRRSVC